ncbi:sugar transferase [Hirschia baltica]|uniref:Exopolysaccharide biosynthesis polyprenyl glycosylphosphotransferase n=1 Tax=Hirschia baltica (strain ATCC 49814 / DSM 5838 / IFAM 1418) TaxID=582402 RepID=C6XPQ5_HIRBI|nr:sugar transferase [Hirschia baltica]ACT60320.1 exopolysaccharide biosynthesis polyprenyl glycosylphosphotransferase [Hirschia baltica ATCC 49814]
MMNEIVSAELANYGFSTKGKGSIWKRVVRYITRLHFQLISGLFLAVVAPALMRGRWEQFADQVASYDNSLLGTTLAFLLGFLFFYKITSFPGIRKVQYVLPSFVAGYVLIVVMFFLLRLDYSRYQFVISFGMTTSWFMVLFLLRKRVTRLRLAYIDGGRTHLLKQLGWVDLVQVKSLEERGNLPLVVDLNESLDEDWERYIADNALRGRPIFHVKQVIESLTGRMPVDHLAENKFGSLAPTTLYAPAKLYVDWFLALSALILLSPLLLVVAIAIRLESPGPAIFKQTRMGFGGKPFTIYKFRSMRQQDSTKVNRNSEMTKSDDDRITKIGRKIRGNRIDELPQILNILKGEMSWIGPRPEAMRLSSWYEEKIPFYRYRHLVRPGITGWAQVHQGHVTSVEDADVKLQYDFFYVRNLSIWLDVLVIFKTFQVVLTGNGAK